MKYQIDDAFVNQLFAHPAFQLKLKTTQMKQNPQRRTEGPASVPSIVEEICTLLSDEFKQKVDSQCLSLYQSHLQIIKEIEHIKNNMFALSPTKAEISSVYKDKSMCNSILSEVEVDQERESPKVRRAIEEVHSKAGNTSFMSSFLFESEVQTKEELQERINATIINLSGDVAKFESSVDERLKNVENSLNRKMESIYKTLTSIFETMNDLQGKLEVRQGKEQGREQGREQNRKQFLEKTIELKLSQKSNKQKQIETKNGEGTSRRRSFLGFLKY